MDFWDMFTVKPVLWRLFELAAKLCTSLWGKQRGTAAVLGIFPSPEDTTLITVGLSGAHRFCQGFAFRSPFPNAFISNQWFK